MDKQIRLSNEHHARLAEIVEHLNKRPTPSGAASLKSVAEYAIDRLYNEIKREADNGNQPS